VRLGQIFILETLAEAEAATFYLKRIYDTKAKHLQILVTGSARLKTFRQS
jgi:hypothetical protein